MIRFSEVPIGSGPRVRCTRCAADDTPMTFRPAAEVVAEASAACASWSGGAGPNIRLTGAEPFAHPELPAVITGVIGAGCRRLELESDAIGLRSPANARGALLSGVRHVRTTFLAGTEGVHDALAGAPGVFEAAREGIAAFTGVAAVEGIDVSVTVVVPVCRHSAHDLPAAIGAAVEAGADRVEMRIADGGLDLTSALPWIVASCDTGVVNGVWVEVEGVPFCLMPGYDLHLADAVRTREGLKAPVCAECPLDPACAGAPEGASTDQLSALAVPPFAGDLAPRVVHARATEAH
jgi:hypothetical protein